MDVHIRHAVHVIESTRTDLMNALDSHPADPDVWRALDKLTDLCFALTRAYSRNPFDTLREDPFEEGSR